MTTVEDAGMGDIPAHGLFPTHPVAPPDAQGSQNQVGAHSPAVVDGGSLVVSGPHSDLASPLLPHKGLVLCPHT